MENPVHTNPNTPSKLYWAKIWSILFEEQSQCTWISFTGPTELKRSSPFACCIPGMVFGKSIQLKNKEYLREHGLLPFSYSEIRLLFLINGIAIRFCECSYFIYVCLDDWCLFGHQWKSFLRSGSNFCEP